ncbi:hypothetical protein ACRC7T_18170 [Segnochrobactraceae bacterium EtOH-i3]
MAREFAPVPVPPPAGGLRKMIVVTCGACGESVEISPQWQTHTRVEAISNHLRRRGWTVGRNKAGADRCPACAKMPRKAASLRCDAAPAPPSPIPCQSTATEAPTIMATDKPAAPAAEPRQPDRESRRLIHAEIETHWLDDAKGYAWQETDLTIARRLGVPPAWVAEVREFSFGPIMVNEDIAAFGREHKAISDQIVEMAKAHLSLAKQIEDARASLGALTRRAEPILKAVRP